MTGAVPWNCKSVLALHACGATAAYSFPFLLYQIIYIVNNIIDYDN